MSPGLGHTAQLRVFGVHTPLYLLSPHTTSAYWWPGKPAPVQGDAEVFPIPQLLHDLLGVTLQRQCPGSRPGDIRPGWTTPQGNLTTRSAPQIRHRGLSAQTCCQGGNNDTWRTQGDKWVGEFCPQHSSHPPAMI